jgi:putative spermidine/putrescine transport system permease protein
MMKKWQFNRSQQIILVPGIFLLLFFAIPFLLLIVASLGRSVPGGDWVFGFSANNYWRLYDAYFGNSLFYTLSLAITVAGICLVLAIPFTWMLSECRSRTRILWMIFLLAGLTLSEVLVAFAWQILLSASTGIPKMLFQLGITSAPTPLQPGLGAIIASLVYLAFPYAALLLYAPFCSIDRSLPEAAQTLGAGRFRTFWTVILPAVRGPLIAAFLLVFILSAGSYVTPQILGLPQHWTLPVLIAEQALYRFNLPFASAMAVLLLIAALVILHLAERFRNSKESPT